MNKRNVLQIWKIDLGPILSTIAKFQKLKRNDMSALQYVYKRADIARYSDMAW